LYKKFGLLAIQTGGVARHPENALGVFSPLRYEVREDLMGFFAFFVSSRFKPRFEVPHGNFRIL
jgi:hypothetical protein